jgi:uncharacterized OB-fold protein
MLDHAASLPIPDAAMNDAKRAPAIEGWFTMDAARPHLLGSCCTVCGTYFFPRQASFCRNPDCASTTFEDVELSRTGRVWSYTNACYEPPEPFVAPKPFEPFAIAAVELEREKMIVLGQVVAGVGVEELEVGMPMELVLETLYRDGDTDKLIWKWKPAGGVR